MVAKQQDQAKAQTRQEQKIRKQKAKDEKLLNKRFIRVRMFPIWFRVLLLLALLAGSLMLGLMVGYGVLGDGNPKDVFDKSTWQHIIDLVKSNN